MEQEYKWKLARPEDAQPLISSPQIRSHIFQQEVISMGAVYYDSPDGLLRQKMGALRLRRENGSSVCCIKLPVAEQGACTLRQEYETEADDVETGLARLPAAGAPAELCAALAASPLVELCRIDYKRQAWRLELEEDGQRCRGELTVDLGQALREGTIVVPISEMEFELLEGSEALFHAFAARLEREFGLVTEHRSKLARAMDL